MPRHAIQLGNAWEPRTADAGRWLRRFGRPSGIGPGDTVVIVVERETPDVPWRLVLNDAELSFAVAAGGRLEYDITALLRDRNELLVVSDAAAPTAVDVPRGRPRFPEEWGRIFIEIIAPH